jgi:hypothetical protein
MSDERVLVTQPVGGWLGPTGNVGAVDKKSLSLIPGAEPRYLYRPVPSSSLYRLIAVFWDVAPCSLVSFEHGDELSASIEGRTFRT